ncbi:uncharacterized protein LOC110033620 [Phalaenopsis equestris]|uniref:uncharacterized protein LOC110033620 n=1 Tax=Phalaenopsis equestris TaxID=78828 RepID=UPI0009E231AD|nr:uncharacterized protein LOC110033620 [Phalaenopsis equestris]
MESLLDGNQNQKKTFFPSKPMKDELPISQTPNKETHLIGLRRRLISSFSIKIQPLSSSAVCSWASLRRSKSAPEFVQEFTGGSLRRWWEWSWSWLLSKKPGFVRDLEMNEEETEVLGYHRKGSVRHLFYKIRSEIRKLVQPQRLPTTHCKFRYDSFSYAQNFDGGHVREEK